MLNSPVLSGAATDDGIGLEVGGQEPMSIVCRTVINAAGHGAPALSRAITGVPAETVPPNYYSIGHYYTLTGKTPFNHLVYPVARHDWLGVHVTIDLGGRLQFGPDFSWRDSLDYRFDESREARFYEAIRRYYPGLKDGSLQPGYTGMRPRITGKDQAAADFVIQDRTVHGVNGMVNLYGIEVAGTDLVAGDWPLRRSARRKTIVIKTTARALPQLGPLTSASAFFQKVAHRRNPLFAAGTPTRIMARRSVS